MSYELEYDDDGKAEWVHVKEEPDCTACNDDRKVWLDVADRIIGQWDTDTYELPFRLEGCPSCSPSEEMMAKFEAADREHLDWLESHGAEEAIF